MRVRIAVPSDLDAITAIYGENVLHGTGSFEEAPPSIEDMRGRHARVTDAGWPWLVAEIDGVAWGYAYAAAYHVRSGWRFTCENSVYVHPDTRRLGIGAALLGALIPAARRAGFRTMLAVIGDSANTGSIALHERFGFAEVGTMRNVGYKFGRWLDVVTMQLILPETP